MNLTIDREARDAEIGNRSIEPSTAYTLSAAVRGRGQVSIPQSGIGTG